VKLKITNSATCNTSDSITKTFTVSPSNKASFTVIQDSCGPTVKMNGTAFTGGNIAVKYLWEFGDGDTSTQTLTPIHPYSANGTYTIKLIANPGDGCADTASQTISYNVAGRLLVASFNPATNQRCEPTQLQFRNTSENGKQAFWYINSQLVSQNLVGFDSIADKGIYRVKLIIKDSTTCKKVDTTERTYYVFKELYPDFTTDVDSCVLGIQFNNTTVNPTNDSVPMYWEFGDGSSSAVKSPFHRYQDTGWYDVKLTLNRGLPCETSITKKVHLEYNTRVLSARFEANPLTLCAPDTLRATNKSINAAKWYWLVNQVIEDSVNFNYLDTIINQQPYLLSLVIYNEHTCKVYDTAVFNLPVFEGAKASFEVTRDKCTPFLNIVNTSKHTTSSTDYFWSFSDGTTSTSQTPTYSSAVDTNLIITLILNPGSPCADTATKTFYYKANSQLLLVDMQVNDSTLCLPAYFNAQSTGYNGMTFTWYLNNVKVDTGLRFMDTLKTAGTYALKLVVTDTNSCIGADSLEKRIEVNEQANANFVMQRDSCSLDVTFINTSSNTQVNRIWYLGDGDSSTENIVKHQYRQTNTYTIKLITSPGNFCADTAEQIHYIDGDTAKEVFIPNVFTPNQDGYNDCFKVNGVNPKCDFYQIIVYNRWGNVVFENTDGSFCWNGNSQSGDPLPAGVYYYVLKLKKQNGLSLDEHGTVTLIREEGK
jgi:gliding motility-associated-like protein